MAWPGSLSVALKEWDVVCRALGEGRQIVLLRKGGIIEENDQFTVEYPQFLMFPTFLHQNTAQLKPAEHSALRAYAEEPGEVEISLAGVVTDVIRLHERTQMDALAEEHVWASALFDMRFNYRPENPLYLLLVRAYRLPHAVKIANTPAYAGCKSWVPLGREIGTERAVPVMDEERYAARRGRILAALGKSE